MVSLEYLILVVALFALWAQNASLSRRLTEAEAILDDHDDDLEYAWDYHNERWQAVSEQFEMIGNLLQAMNGDHPED